MTPWNAVAGCSFGEVSRNWSEGNAASSSTMPPPVRIHPPCMEPQHTCSWPIRKQWDADGSSHCSWWRYHGLRGGGQFRHPSGEETLLLIFSGSGSTALQQITLVMTSEDEDSSVNDNSMLILRMLLASANKAASVFGKCETSAGFMLSVEDRVWKQMFEVELTQFSHHKNH